VDCLEPDPGYAKASEGGIEALKTAVKAVHENWPLERPVPPKLLWSNTVDFAATLASAGLRRKDIAEDGTRSWTEVPFGQPAGFVAGRGLPWDATTPVTVPDTPVRLSVTIDRLDMRSAPSAARVGIVRWPKEYSLCCTSGADCAQPIHDAHSRAAPHALLQPVLQGEGPG
jgi:hypothetical protein